MTITFFDKLVGFFDRRFIIAYWMPVFVSAGLVGVIVAAKDGLEPYLKWWNEMSSTEQVVLTVTTLLALSVVAYLLQALTTPIIRFYEGYTLPGWLAEWLKTDQRQRLNQLTTVIDEPEPVANTRQRNRFYHFPDDPDQIRPTKLGNTLTAAETHSYNTFRIDAVLWWPRLFTLLPESFLKQIDAALTPMISLLNLSMLLTLISLSAGFYLWRYSQQWWLFVIIFTGGLALAKLCYEAAVQQAVSYGSLIRTAFDLYRHKILKEMGIFIPDNLEEEMLLWEVLNKWIYINHRLPQHSYIEYEKEKISHKTPDWLKAPFYYKKKQEPSSPPIVQVVLKQPLLVQSSKRRKKRS